VNVSKEHQGSQSLGVAVRDEKPHWPDAMTLPIFKRWTRSISSLSAWRPL